LRGPNDFTVDVVFADFERLRRRPRRCRLVLRIGQDHINGLLAALKLERVAGDPHGHEHHRDDRQPSETRKNCNHEGPPRVAVYQLC
jgi:hypothetical protein